MSFVVLYIYCSNHMESEGVNYRKEERWFKKHIIL